MDRDERFARGEPADAHGFEVRSHYPTTSHMEMAVAELTGRNQSLPFFAEVRTEER